MARARNIKPGFYKNDELAECSIWARYIFPGLWMLADREGRLEDRPRRIKAELLPFDTQDAEPLLSELAAMKDAQGVPFIIRYQNSDGRFIQISKFLTHQKPHYSEKKSVIKPHEFLELVLDDEAEKPDKSGKVVALRGGRNALNPSSLNPSSLNPDCVCVTPHHTQVRDEFLNAIRTARPDLDPETIFQEFRAHYPPEKCTLAKWKKWIELEKRPVVTGPPDATADPDSRSSIEALGLSRGFGKWDEMQEPFLAYKNRVRGVTA